jgi:UDP-glucose 4,6-dehydratase
MLARKYPQYKIVNMDSLDYCSNLKNLEAVADAPNYLFVKGSITSADLVNYLLRKERIDTIMHFAAQTHVDNSFGNSIAFTESNILGTHVLLEAAKEAPHVKLFVHVSTDEVYGDGSGGAAAQEGAVLEPTNPYAATKAGAEYLVKAYHRSFNLPVIITRGNNVYGPHQYPEKIVPKFVNQLARGLPITLHGTGANTRNYMFVEDVARAFDVILHRGEVGAVYNIGGRNEISNIEVARAVLRLMGLVQGEGEGVAEGAVDGGEATPGAGSDARAAPPRPPAAATAATAAGAAAAGATVAPPASVSAAMAAAERRHIVYVPDRPFNDLRYPLDCSRLTALGWREEVSWEDGLRRTVDWYLRYSGNWPDVESALVPHPRRGYTRREVLEGKPDDDYDTIAAGYESDDAVAGSGGRDVRARLRVRSNAAGRCAAPLGRGAGATVTAATASAAAQPVAASMGGESRPAVAAASVPP